MSKKIAVIGAGIFGTNIAITLSKDGHNVQIFESKDKILNGTSFNNTRRVHLGFHYPRDIETAKQSFEGFKDFCDAYRDCLISNFDNFYLIAKNNSKTNVEDYLSFCSQISAPFKFVTDQLIIDVKNCEGGIKCDEFVYDCDLLRKIMLDEIYKNNISLFLSSKVNSIKKSKRFEIYIKDNSMEEFDAVVNCSYYNINQFNQDLNISCEPKQYEYTVNFIIDLPIDRIGITIMDGPFVTLLPFGEEPGRFILYHVSHSVIEKVVSEYPPTNWTDSKNILSKSVNIQELFRNTINDSSFFIPILKKAKLVKILESPRVILANKEDTDARPSFIENPIFNYFTVFSGKIDHCFGVSRKISEHLSN